MGAMLGAIVSAMIMMLPTAVQELSTGLGNRTMDKLINIAKKIYTKISQNQEDLLKLQEAFSRKDSELMTEILQSTGFGPRSTELKKAREIVKQDYETEKSKNLKQTAELQNLYNEANQASYNTQSFTGQWHGEDVAKRIQENLDQQINGGAHETSEKQ